MKTVYALLLLLVIGYLGQIFCYYSRLPDVIAIHFGPSGNADAWTSKNQFVIFGIGLMFLLLFLINVLTALLFTVVPDRYVNLPNKEYWLTPERRGETAEKINGHMAMFTSGLVLFMITVQQLVINANLSGTNKLNNTVMVATLVLFFSFVGYWFFLLSRKFKVAQKKPNDPCTN